LDSGNKTNKTRAWPVTEFKVAASQEKHDHFSSGRSEQLKKTPHVHLYPLYIQKICSGKETLLFGLPAVLT